MKGLKRLDKKGKLSPRYVNSFRILSHFRKVAYELELPSDLSFHISLLKKCISDPAVVVPLESVDIQNSLSFEEVPVEILDHQVADNIDKSIGIKSGDDTMEDAYFDWNRILIQPQSEDIEGCSEDIEITTLDALIEAVDDYSSSIPEFAQAKLDVIIEAHQAAKNPTKRTRTKSKVFKSPYLIKFPFDSKIVEDQTVEMKQKFAFNDFIISDNMSRDVIEEYKQWVDEGLFKFHAKKDCGVFVVRYVEYLSEGIDVPSINFEAEYHRMRYASLLLNYGIHKAKKCYAREDCAKSFKDTDFDSFSEKDNNNDLVGPSIEKDVQVIETSQIKASRKIKHSFEVQDVVGDISIKFGEVATAIDRMVDSRLDVTKLYEEVMVMKGYNEEFLGDAFDYLVQSDTLAKAFMVKNQNLRKNLDQFSADENKDAVRAFELSLQESKGKETYTGGEGQ
ncbi:putative zinc finger protein VAR3, chloroplastic-like [Capsicum annuum]|nr:putative zinc finger protein VAR3, chloroplastic-like [Capsicum annuum]